MRGVMRWIGLFLLLVVVVLAAATAWLYLTFDPEDYKTQIAQQVQERTGRQLSLDGPLELSVFPWLGLTAQAVKLGNPPSFAEGDFISAERMEARVDVVPLLDGQVVVDTLVLDTVRLNLHRSAEGKENWADLLAAAEAKPAPDGAAGPDKASEWIKGYVVQGVELTGARVAWRDDVSGSHHVLEDVTVVTGSIAPGKEVPVELALRLTSGDGKPMGAFKASGDLGLSDDFTRLSIPNLVLAVSDEGAGHSLQMQTKATFDRSSGLLDLGDLKVTGPGDLLLNGKLTAELAQQTPVVKGHLVLQPLNPRKFADAMGVTLPKTQDPSVLTRLSGEIDLEATAEKVTLKPLYLALDETRIGGELGMVPGSPPVLTFNLEADAIDVDRYLAPETEKAASSQEDKGNNAGPKGAGNANNQDAGLAALGALNADGVIAVGSLKAGGLSMSNVRVKVSSGGGKVSLDPMTAALYGGSYKGNIHLRAEGKTIGWQAREQLSSIQIGPLLQDVAGDDRIEGTGNLEANLQGVGLSDAQIRRSLEGQASFTFTDGALKGVNLAQLVRDIKARLKGRAPEQPGPVKTDFSEMSGTLRFGQGEVRNNDLMMKSPFIRVDGKGKANLVTEELDYLLTAKVVGTAKGQGGDDIAELDGVIIPVKVAGTFVEPTFTPDLDAALKAVAGKQLDEEKAKLEQKAKEQITKEQDKLEEKLQDEVGKALRKLF